MSTLRKTGKRVTWDKFREKFNNYILDRSRHAEEVVFMSTSKEDPTTDFKARHMPKYLTEEEEKKPYNKKMWEIKLNNYF